MISLLNRLAIGRTFAKAAPAAAGPAHHGQGEGRGMGDSRPRGRAATALDVARSRLVVGGTLFAIGFAAVGVRLVDATVIGGHVDARHHDAVVEETTRPLGRADIVDRTGALLAKALPLSSVYADPAMVIEPKAAARELARLLPDVNEADLAAKLGSEKRFVWIRRHLTPIQQAAIHRAGIPGVFFEREYRRFYPTGALCSHVVGFTDIDNKGLAGVEQSFDTRLKSEAEPLQLSIDARLQNILRTELLAQIQEFRAIGAAGMIMDVRTAEVMAMVSLPDFDPQAIDVDNPDARFNRNTLGVYEMGSTFKIFNTAMALDSGRVHINEVFDAANAIRVGRYTISDYHGKHRPLTVGEVFIYSSNIGSVRMALKAGGAPQQRAFMERVGFLRPLPIELPERGEPLVPNPWREINAMTIAFGHGLSVSPLHLVTGTAAVVNGGIYRDPTLLKRKPDDDGNARRIIAPETSAHMRALMLDVVEKGTATKAAVPGYMVGGKTGTAEKQQGRHYSTDARMSSFVGVFPMNEPRYVVYVLLDEPKPSAKSYGYATGGWVAAPAVSRVVAQIAPILGLRPVEAAEGLLLTSATAQPAPVTPNRVPAAASTAATVASGAAKAAPPRLGLARAAAAKMPATGRPVKTAALPSGASASGDPVAQVAESHIVVPTTNSRGEPLASYRPIGR